MKAPACALAGWAAGLEPTELELALADRALLDTVAVAFAAADHPIGALLDELGEAGRLAALAHVLDFDDLHLPSTAHVSAICVPAVLAVHGDARAYLAGAGVMARLGAALGWSHYRRGWHATCTAGAPAAAAAAAVALGLDADGVARAIALAVPAAGGVQRAFGTTGKALQVGFAADAGVRAAALAEAGAGADPHALEDWLRLLGGDPGALVIDGDAVPGGLAIKLYPCCYALQRPINAVAGLPEIDGQDVCAVTVRTPESSLAPLIHHAPTTGLQGKFSLEYGVAAALLDRQPDLDSFGDAGVTRPEALRLMELVEVEAVPGGDGLLAGEVQIEVRLDSGEALQTTLDLPPGAPGRPAGEGEWAAKLQMCGADGLRSITWETATGFLAAPARAEDRPPSTAARAATSRRPTSARP